MKICMVGVRGHNDYVFEGLVGKADARILGLSSGTPEDDASPLVETCRQAGQSPAVFDDYRRMLDEVRPDVLTVAGPFDRTAETVAEALNRGVSVFAEKPLATSLSGLDTVQQAHRSSKAHLAAMFGIRYAPAFYTAWRAVTDGAIGQVRLISAQKSYRLGKRPEYFHSREHSGGTIPWVGSHAIDWLEWFSGQRFESVCARHSTRHNRDHGELEISAMCQFELSGEVLASVSIDYLRPAAAPSHGDDRVRLAGTDGVLEVRGGAAYLINADGEQTLRCECGRTIFGDFLRQVRGDSECLVSAEESIRVTRACLLARQSADEKRIVRFDRPETGPIQGRPDTGTVSTTEKSQ